VEDLSQYKTADALLAHINDQVKTLTSDLGSRDPSVKSLIPQIWASTAAMIKLYPNDPHVWETKMLAAQVGIVAGRLKIPGAPTPQEISGQFDAISGDKAAPQMAQAEASAMAISQAMQWAGEGGADASANWDVVETRIAGFQKQFGNVFSFDGTHPAIALIRSGELSALKGSGNTARYQALLKKLLTDTVPEIAAMAGQELAEQKKLADLQSKPFDLKLTAVDGTAIDVAKMRGKVVLIDFWATWCGPCREEVPNVVAAYKKYHDQGFEVVGISLDQDKAAMMDFTKQNGMVWPQYFDGKGWDNSVSKGFGIVEIPTMWLIGKDGRLATTDGREDLAGQVGKLLK
jgi:thiol-disulfide isomerase/thioredoxin